VKAPSTRQKVAALGLLVGIVVLALPLWLPFFGTALAVDDALQPADVALVLEGTARDATDAAELWRQQGLVRDVVIVEAPVRTHALVAYWSDFVGWGMALPPSTPADHLRVVRSPSTQAAQQAQAALASLQGSAARRVLVPGGGGIGSRLVERELLTVLAPVGIDVRLVRYRDGSRDPARWFQNAEDRRAVLDSWLQFAVPFLSGYEPGAGT
jgi:hypothetical protein